MGDVARLKAMLGHTVLREEWLDRAGGILERWVFSGHVQVPAYRVSVGWPLGSRVSKRPGEAGCVGQCFSASCSSDYVAQIFISPTLSDSIKVLGVLAHEIIHAIFPTAGHRGLFRKLALAIGLEGEMTSTYPGAALKEIFESKVLKELGDYPGAALSYHTTKKRKKDGIRQIKCTCPECGWTFRASQKWIDIGTPICQFCNLQFVAENQEGEESE